MNTNKKNKNIEHEVLPEGWKVKKLHEIANLVSGLHLNPNEYNNLCLGIPYFTGPSDFSNNINEISKYTSKTSAIAIQNDILLTVKGSGVGTFHQLKLDKIAIGRQLMAIRVKQNTSAIFIYHSIPQKLHYFQGLAKGNMIPGLTRNDILGAKILLPPLPEQRAIASCLSAWDAAIQKSTQLVAQKELRKKWLMQQLLTGKKRLRGFEGEWKESHLGDVFSERNETRYNDLILLSIGQTGVYPQAESIKKDTSNEDKSKYKRICPGDIGYNTMRMWQGRSAISQLEGIVSPAYTIITPTHRTDSLFFAYLFKTPKLMHLFWRNSQGLVDDTLNCKFKDFSIIKIPLPEKNEQTAIAAVLQAADQEIQLLKAQVEKLKEQKKGMMQVLLTGKVRLKTVKN